MSDPPSSRDPADHSTDVHCADTVTGQSVAASGSVDDLAAELCRTPELARDRSYVIDRAVAEFKKLSLGTPNLSPHDYSRRFAAFDSSLQSSIVRQLEVEQFIENHPWLVHESPEAWPAPGEKFGPFEMIEELGRGGLARVYLCRQPGMGHRQVVVKLGRSALVEAHTLGQLRHPNIVPVHSAEIEPRTGMAMLCMAFLGRSTLCDFIEMAMERHERPTGDILMRAAQRRHRATDEVVDDAHRYVTRPDPDFDGTIAYLGERLAGALSHAHRLGIVHGDVKPSNILLSFWGEPLLMDFNLSGNADLDVKARGGTLPYMPPEQLQLIVENSHTVRYDARSDIFSLGAVFYELLTGQPPFTLIGKEADQVDMAAELLKRQADGYVPLSGDDSVVPRSLARIIDRCLEQVPDQRFQTAEELRSAFQRELRTSARWRRWARRRKHALALASALTAAVAILAAAWIQSRPPAHVRHFDRGRQLQQAGNLAGAEREFEQSLKVAADFADARFEFARTLMRQGKLEQAGDEFYRLVQTDPTACNAAYLGYCLCRQRRLLAAIPWLRRAESQGAEAPELHNNLAVAYELGSTEHPPDERRRLAQQHLEIALRQLPQSPTVRFNWIAQKVEQHTPQDGGISSHTLRMATQLAEEFPSDGVVNDLAAIVIALTSPLSDSQIARGGGFLAAAIRQGSGPDRQAFLEMPLWSVYRHGETRERILAAFSEPRPAHAEVAISRFLEPISLRQKRGDR